MEVIIYTYTYVSTWVERPTHVGVGTSFISLGSGAEPTSYHDSPHLDPKGEKYQIMVDVRLRDIKMK